MHTFDEEQLTCLCMSAFPPLQMSPASVLIYEFTAMEYILQNSLQLDP